MHPPAFKDILDAKLVVDRYLQPTPLHHYPNLSKLLGFTVFIKHENHQPIGSFKIRGGINLVSRLSDEEREAGVIAASTGNHGQSVTAAGISIAAKAINPKIEIIGVQSEHASVVHDSWKARKVLSSDKSGTFAEGMATRQAFQLTLDILIQHLDDFVLVSDQQLFGAIATLFDHTHNVAEGAGAASFAAAVKIKDRLAGKKVALDLSGGNITRETLKRILN